MWEQIKNVPLSNITQRSESPQPIIPTRPAFESLPAATPSTSSSALPRNPEQTSGGSFATQRLATAKPSFAAGAPVPAASSSPLYRMPPQYAVVPGSNPLSPTQASTSGNVYPVLYEEPPVESVLPNIPAHDVPPTENGRLPSIGKMMAQFDFKPVGPNQLEITAVPLCSRRGVVLEENTTIEGVMDFEFAKIPSSRAEPNYSRTTKDAAVSRDAGGSVKTVGGKLCLDEDDFRDASHQL
ncbi:hypothetical protein ANCCAN_00322 [Ancylostoma caninum]|uniref:Uncharacterized protein n=1 Tax=Ancylostoma caninum TaxID=29170 RepID=A0A368H9H9_ANCCA|nr:hypothetical protein ANCCAN_00322 [Ancylostoma caninum]